MAQHQSYTAVGKSLLSFGVDYFIPMIETLTVVHGRRVREQRPLLGDYIPIAITGVWKSLLSVRGVRGILLNTDGLPAQVLPGEMNRLREMCNEDGVYQTTEEEAAGFSYGQRVTPKDGPFVYHVGRYDRRTKRGNDVALFCLFGGEKQVTFKCGELLAV